MPSVLAPVTAKTVKPAAAPPGALVQAVLDDPTALVYFLVNVGDGDTQLLLLPPDSNDDLRRLVVVDVATAGKLPALIEALHAVQLPSAPGEDRRLIEAPGSPGQIRLLVATHPHADHIGGMCDLLRRYNNAGGCIDQFWEPGYFFPSPTFHQLMTQLETSPWIRRLQPTSGTTCYFDTVKITVLGPGVGLRTRFDTYGVDVNDASITLMVEYPAVQMYAETDPGRDRQNRRMISRRNWRLLLGADAQFTSWAQATVDFPDLKQTQNPVLAKELDAARSNRDYLSADVFKLSHHASKHGVSLELMERAGASYTLVSSVSGGGSYNFPHALAMDAAREARQAIAKSGARRQTDHDLGIHATGGVLAGRAQQPLGSIAVLIPQHPRPTGRLRLFRLLDEPRARIDLAGAREVVT
jgi:glyoxylase-like metal-dependent hydrolase (beta-lactamase superfamily II)